MGLEPFLELILFGLVRIEAFYALPYDAVSLQHLEVEVPVGAAGLLHQLFLVLDPGEGVHSGIVISFSFWSHHRGAEDTEVLRTPCLKRSGW